MAFEHGQQVSKDKAYASKRFVFNLTRILLNNQNSLFSSFFLCRHSNILCIELPLGLFIFVTYLVYFNLLLEKTSTFCLLPF